MMLLIGETSLQYVGARAVLEKRNSCESLFCYGNHSDGRCDVGRSVVYAESAAIPTTPEYATLKSAKRVSFNMRNDSKMAIKVKAGDNGVVLEPGKIVPMKLQVGVQVVAEATTPNYPSGMVLAIAATYLSDSTITLH